MVARCPFSRRPLYIYMCVCTRNSIRNVYILFVIGIDPGVYCIQNNRVSLLNGEHYVYICARARARNYQNGD